MGDTERFKEQMRIIGFYNKPNQDMAPEQVDVECADSLAVLLNKSFKSLCDNPKVDNIFKSVINGNSVFILKSKSEKLYGYYPLKNIARITNVKYTKTDVTPVPFVYKGWFIPGEDVPMQNKSAKQKNNGYVLSSSGSDFLITIGNRTRPLSWNEDKYISFSDLRTILSHKYTSLVEYCTADRCGDCDGYDYSDCDMDRCKDDCENCGGRRFKCNNGCFNHRYDYAYEIEVKEDEISKRVEPILKKLEEANAPHCKRYKEIYSQISQDIADMRAEFYLLYKYFNSGYDALVFELARYEVLSYARDKSKLLEPACIFGLKVDPTHVKVQDHAIFWKRWHIETDKVAYDYDHDKFVSFDFKLHTPKPGIIEDIQDCLKYHKMERLRILLSIVKIKDKRITYIDEVSSYD